MFWFLWTLLASHAGVVRSFSIAPIAQPVIVSNPINIIWFRSAEDTDDFVFVKNIIDNNRHGPPPIAIVTVNPTPGQTMGTVEITFNQIRNYVLQAVKTDAQGDTQSAFFTDQQTITPVPSASDFPSPPTSIPAPPTVIQVSQSGSTGSDSTSTSGQSVTISIATSTTESDPTSGTTSSTPDSTKGSHNDARSRTTIIASTIAGTTLLILLLVVFLFRRNLQFFILPRMNWKYNIGRDEGENIIIPYSERRAEERPHRNDKVQLSRTASLPGHQLTSSDSPRAIQQTNNGIPSEGAPRDRRVVYHNDSGWRPPRRDLIQADEGGSGSSVINMPPKYDEAL